MRQLFIVVCLCWLVIAFSKCTSVPKEKTGEELAKTYCTTCHAFADPFLLDKETWRNRVLPIMADKLGIGYYNDMPFQLRRTTTTNNTTQNAFTIIEWNKIARYYDSLAPEKLPDQNRKKIIDTPSFFVEHDITTRSAFPFTTYVKIDAGNKFLYTADGLDSSLHAYNINGKSTGVFNLHSIITDINFNEDISMPGNRSGVCTNIGILRPNDTKSGSLKSFTLLNNNLSVTKLQDSIRRPVSTVACDLNKDGRTDYVVCGFGNKAGEFFYLLQQADGSFAKHILWSIPGAIKAYVKDVNKDDLPDIIVLFAQAEEGIYEFINKGNNNFEKKQLLSFPPVYGSSYFEMSDMNNDGFDDIIYTCGDNADYSSNELKFYHGVYIFLHQPDGSYKKEYFFPQHGSYKAIAADMDNDGDKDLVAISFFADNMQQPQEAFIYLENKGALKFRPYALNGFSKGKWLTLDVADADGDGDNDIIAGSFTPPSADKTEVSKVAAVYLENRTKK